MNSYLSVEDRRMDYHRNTFGLRWLRDVTELPPLLVGEVQMFFDDEATLAMGAAFDQACSSLGRFAGDNNARELIAKRIIEAAIKGERDPVRLHSQVFMQFCMDDLSVPIISAPQEMPVAIFAAIARTA